MRELAKPGCEKKDHGDDQHLRKINRRRNVDLGPDLNVSSNIQVLNAAAKGRHHDDKHSGNQPPRMVLQFKIQKRGDGHAHLTSMVVSALFK
jgi:hypothetical protein